MATKNSEPFFNLMMVLLLAMISLEFKWTCATFSSATCAFTVFWGTACVTSVVLSRCNALNLNQDIVLSMHMFNLICITSRVFPQLPSVEGSSSYFGKPLSKIVNILLSFRLFGASHVKLTLTWHLLYGVRLPFFAHSRYCNESWSQNVLFPQRIMAF